MSLKVKSANILNKLKTDRKSQLCAAAVSVIILAFIAIIVFLSVNDHQRRLQMEQEQLRLEELEKKYSAICKEYDSSVDDYNNSVLKINNFIENISEYNLIQSTDPLVAMDHIDENFGLFHNNGDDFSAIEQETESIKNKTDILENDYFSVCKTAYLGAIHNYNLLAKEYNYLTCHSSVDYISDMPSKAAIKKTTVFDIYDKNFSEEKLLNVISNISEETDNLISYYLVLKQITAPSDEWVMQRIGNVSSIRSFQKVTPDNDPNGLLKMKKNAGYMGCIYFSLSNIDQDSVNGSTIIEKGTDAGGAIEIYPTLESALNRCKYLSQFDNTFLYSGSYTVVGTMVIRTSYKLSNQEQVNITDQIIRTFTELQVQ